MTTIRRAAAADAAPLATLAERTFREAFAEQNAAGDMDAHCAKRFGAAIQAGEIADPALVTFVAEDAGRLVAFAQLRLAHGTDCLAAANPAELNRIYVAADRHGSGVAGALLRAVLAEAAAAGCDRLWLGVWEHNPRAIAFYRKWGFREVGEHSFMLGSDRQRDVILALDLAARGTGA